MPQVFVLSHCKGNVARELLAVHFLITVTLHTHATFPTNVCIDYVFFFFLHHRTLMHRDSTLSPTPPFQQSLGLVTSSAEQECCSYQDSGARNNSQTSEFHTPGPSRRRSPGDSSDSGSVLTPLSFSSLLAPNYSHMTFGGESGNPSFINPCLNISPAGHIPKVTSFSTSKLDEPSLADSVVWEDLPFSESLSKFLYEENMVDNVINSEREVNVEDQVETPKNSSKSISRERNLTCKSTLLPLMQTQMADRRSQTLMNITNTGHIANDYHEQPGHVRSVTRRYSKNLTFEEHNLEDADAILLGVEREESFSRDSYNFSADLFSCSLVNNVTTNAHTESVRASFPEFAAADQKSPESEAKRKSFIPAEIQEHDFIPPSQSTPIVRAAVAPHRSYRPNRFGHSFHPKWSFGKVGEERNQLLSQQHVEIHMDSPSVGSTAKFRHKRDSGCSDLTACDNEDSREARVAKTKPIGKDQRAHCKRVRLTQAPSAPHTQAGSCGSGTSVEGGLEGWTDDSYVCNYSRDLFSDSV